MDLSFPAMTPEMRQALQASGGSPFPIQDPETLQVYMVVEQPAEITLDEAYIRSEIQVALDQLARGECEEWDIEAVIAEARSRHGK